MDAFLLILGLLGLVWLATGFACASGEVRAAAREVSRRVGRDVRRPGVGWWCVRLELKRLFGLPPDRALVPAVARGSGRPPSAARLRRRRTT